MRKQKFTVKQVSDALIKADGIKSVAARMLKCHRRTIDDYIKRHPACEAAYSESIEAAGDTCESALMKLVRQGNPSAIIFALKTRFRHRGYGVKEPPQSTSPIEFNINLGNPENEE
ncbi:hypothetical protein [Cerasicoccus frondis]|uniref:hypothetical protein n=1 Tax=Cerasicoccus frondis TaxID=490090 RepID=UPI002852B1CF|nr:hypothetical protein [Cerasicoccus frondis]